MRAVGQDFIGEREKLIREFVVVITIEARRAIIIDYVPGSRWRRLPGFDNPPGTSMHILAQIGMEFVSPEWLVRTSVDAAEGLNVIQNGGVDIVLIDFNMPETDGLTMAALIRETDSRMPS